MSFMKLAVTTIEELDQLSMGYTLNVTPYNHKSIQICQLDFNSNNNIHIQRSKKSSLLQFFICQFRFFDFLTFASSHPSSQQDQQKIQLHTGKNNWFKAFLEWKLKSIQKQDIGKFEKMR